MLIVWGGILASYTARCRVHVKAISTQVFIATTINSCPNQKITTNLLMKTGDHYSYYVVTIATSN